MTGVPQVPVHGYGQPETALGGLVPVQVVSQAGDPTSSEPTSEMRYSYSFAVSISRPRVFV